MSEGQICPFRLATYYINITAVRTVQGNSWVLESRTGCLGRELKGSTSDPEQKPL